MRFNKNSLLAVSGCVWLVIGMTTFLMSLKSNLFIAIFYVFLGIVGIIAAIKSIKDEISESFYLTKMKNK